MNKLRNQKIGIVLVLLCLCFGFGYFLHIQPRKPENSSPLFNRYEKYLNYTTGDINSVEVFVEPTTKYQDYDYYVTVHNASNQFVCGTLQLVSAKDNVCFEKRYINLKPFEENIIAIAVDVVPVDYKWKNVSFYEYTYPGIDVETMEAYDYDEAMGYVWMDVITSDALDADACLAYAEYIYVQDILAGSEYVDIFFYTRDDVVYEQKGNENYPDINSAYYASAFDGEKLQIVDLETSKIIKEKLLK